MYSTDCVGVDFFNREMLSRTLGFCCLRSIFGHFVPIFQVFVTTPLVGFIMLSEPPLVPPVGPTTPEQLQISMKSGGNEVSGDPVTGSPAEHIGSGGVCLKKKNYKAIICLQCCPHHRFPPKCAGNFYNRALCATRFSPTKSHTDLSKAKLCKY